MSYNFSIKILSTRLRVRLESKAKCFVYAVTDEIRYGSLNTYKWKKEKLFSTQHLLSSLWTQILL